MTTRKKAKKSQRGPRSEDYMKEEIELAETVDVTQAAKRLGMQTTQIYYWHSKLGMKESRTRAEIPLMEENARLTRELAEKKQKNAFLKRWSSNSVIRCVG